MPVIDISPGRRGFFFGGGARVHVGTSSIVGPAAPKEEGEGRIMRPDQTLPNQTERQPPLLRAQL